MVKGNLIACLDLEDNDKNGDDVVDEAKGAKVTRSWKRRVHLNSITSTSVIGDFTQKKWKRMDMVIDRGYSNEFITTSGKLRQKIVSNDAVEAGC